MSTTFPTSIDSFTNPTGTDQTTSPSHAAQHANANDAIEAIETYVLAHGRELGYGQRTSSLSITATTEGTAQVVAQAICDVPAAPVLVEVYFPIWQPSATVGQYITATLHDGTSSIALLGSLQTPVGTNALLAPFRATYRYTPSAGTKTYSACAYVGAGTGSVTAGPGGAGAYVPAFIRIVLV